MLLLIGIIFEMEFQNSTPVLLMNRVANLVFAFGGSEISGVSSGVMMKFAVFLEEIVKDIRQFTPIILEHKHSDCILVNFRYP